MENSETTEALHTKQKRLLPLFRRKVQNINKSLLLSTFIQYDSTVLNHYIHKCSLILLNMLWILIKCQSQKLIEELKSQVKTQQEEITSLTEQVEHKVRAEKEIQERLEVQTVNVAELRAEVASLIKNLSHLIFYHIQGVWLPCWGVGVISRKQVQNRV